MAGSCTLVDMISEHDGQRIDPAAQGAWVPLTDAVDEVATLRRLVYRLVSDGKLRSRESTTGEIEVWIRDDDLSNIRSLSVIGPAQSAATAESSQLSVGQQLSVLIGPLAASFERNVQLAHENGVLSERAANLERELKALREATTSDKRPLEHATERLRALEAAQMQPARVSTRRDEDRPTSQQWSWAWLAFGAFLCLAAAVVWYFGRPF